jgi:hypothetical protein
MGVEVVVLTSASMQLTPPERTMEQENHDPASTGTPVSPEAEGELGILLKFIGYSNI